MSVLRLVDKDNEIADYPLKLEQTLTRHDWWPYYGAKLVTPAFLARVPDHLQGYAFRLWDHAMTQGDPAGTLPTDPREIGVIVGRHHMPEACHELRTTVLADWTEVTCHSEESPQQVVRLAHPVMTKIAREAWDRRSRKIERRPGRTEDTRRCRLRKKLREIGAPQMADSPRALDAVLAEIGEGRIDFDNVKRAAERVSLRM